MQQEDLYFDIPLRITDLSGWLTTFRGRNNLVPDEMLRPLMEYCDVKKFASEFFNITVSESSLLVQTLAPEQAMNFSSAACRLDLCGTFSSRATKYIFSSAHSPQTRLSTM